MGLRWLFLFLALANSILLFWFSSFVSEVDRSEVEVKDHLNNIRLLNEMDVEALKLKVSDESQESDSCISFEGFRNVQAVEWLVGLVRAQGLVATHSSVAKEKSMYVVKIEVSDEEQQRRTLAEYLRRNRGLEMRAQDIEPSSKYILGRFVQRLKAEQELQKVVLAGIAAYMIFEKVESVQFSVVVHEGIERKLSSEIKGLVTDRYSDVKISKKVCERVARPLPTE
ncbi:MAG: hypothetical protein ACRBB6_14680 [Neptuniibacter sp.]